MTRSTALSGATCSASRHLQRGVAAIEFALVSLALLFCLYLITSLGVMVHTKQVLSRSAAVGALALSADTRDLGAGVEQATAAVIDALNHSLLTPLGVTAGPLVPVQSAAPLGNPGHQEWVRNNVRIFITPSASNANERVVEVRYPYAGNAILPTLPGMGWVIPNQLSGWATVAVGP